MSSVVCHQPHTTGYMMPVVCRGNTAPVIRCQLYAIIICHHFYTTSNVPPALQHQPNDTSYMMPVVCRSNTPPFLYHQSCATISNRPVVCHQLFVTVKCHHSYTTSQKKNQKIMATMIANRTKQMSRFSGIYRRPVEETRQAMVHLRYHHHCNNLLFDIMIC